MIISNMSDVDVAGKEFVRDEVPLVLRELQRPDWWDRQLFDVESVNPGHTDGTQPEPRADILTEWTKQRRQYRLSEDKGGLE